MSQFKFDQSERHNVERLLQQVRHMGLSVIEGVDRIEQIISARGESDGGKLAPEFVELIEIAEYMQKLYRNGRFGLSDEAMVTATAHLDDLMRIPSPPKPDQQ